MNFKEFLKESSITISYNTDSIAETQEQAKKFKIRTKIISNSVLDLTGSSANITKLLKSLGETDTDIRDYIEE